MSQGEKNLADRCFVAMLAHHEEVYAYDFEGIRYDYEISAISESYSRIYFGNNKI